MGGQTRTCASNLTNAQARIILCIEGEKESTSGFELRNVVEHFPLSIVEDKICVGRGHTKTSTSATHTCGQARITLCTEVEKESTRKSVVRKAVEHFPLSIVENEICVGDGISIAIAILSARRDCMHLDALGSNQTLGNE